MSKKFLCLLMLLLMVLFVLPASAREKAIELFVSDYPVEENERYSSMEEVAVYLHLFEELPRNFVTKREAEDMGWNSREGNLDRVAPGYSIGGNRFGNYEGVLPEKGGRKWTECDINYNGGRRGPERICFSNDGLIYYTSDHYNSFTRIDVLEGEASDKQGKQDKKETPKALDEYGDYTERDDVAAYLRQYGRLPVNYLTRNEAKELGWTNKKDNLGELMPGCAIGGDEFQNREKLLPNKKGRTWYECDVNVKDGHRGKERICYSSDGLIYYTPDKYKSFTEL